MSGESEIDYFRRRETQARALAQAAIHPAIRSIHLEMAIEYADLAGTMARALSRSEERLPPRLYNVNLGRATEVRVRGKEADCPRDDVRLHVVTGSEPDSAHRPLGRHGSAGNWR